jgi:hypothetical protein
MQSLCALTENKIISLGRNNDNTPLIGYLAAGSFKPDSLAHYHFPGKMHGNIRARQEHLLARDW